MTPVQVTINTQAPVAVITVAPAGGNPVGMTLPVPQPVVLTVTLP